MAARGFRKRKNRPRTRPQKQMTKREIPICARCGHKATMHVVDGEERGECMEWGCDCEQLEIDLIPCGPKPEEMDDNADNL
jgi:hypothetical protein